jgi:large subunit ribosomal protein L22
MAANVTITPRARAIQRVTRQSPYKMRLVIDQIRGKSVNDALALLKFSKKHAAKQIEKTLASAVANAENKARTANDSIDVDALYVTYAVVNEGPALKRFMPAAQGRATPIRKRTSHVDIMVGERVKKAVAQGSGKKKIAATASVVTATEGKKAAVRKTTKKTAKKTEGEQ